MKPHLPTCPLSPRPRRAAAAWSWLGAAALAGCLQPAHAANPAEAAAAADGAWALQARSLAATCANCHGTAGRAVGDSRPLAGLPAPSIRAAMAAFKAGTLPATVMHQIAKGYTDDQVQLIAAYFEAQGAARREAP